MTRQRAGRYQIRLILMAAFVISGLAPPSGAGAVGPYLLVGSSRECRESLVVADAAFTSRSFYLNEAISLKSNADVDIVGQKATGDISGGFGFIADQTVFSTVDVQGPRPIYWQTTPEGGLRWVVSATSVGWRGDIYALYAIDKGITSKAFNPQEGRESHAVVDGLIPPVMLRDRKTHSVWALVTGAAYQVLGDWSVYAERGNAAKKICTIRFSPPVKTAFALLPKSARVLALELDGILGDGGGEGTLHPTATLRYDIQAAWANAVLRPWALTQEPYNTRHDVDAGLERWSQRASNFQELYKRIKAQYPRAQQSLAKLYVERFNKTPEQASALAARNLDIIYRSHFMFTQDFVRPASKPGK